MTDVKKIKFTRPILLSQSDALALETEVWSRAYAAGLTQGVSLSVADRADAAVIAWRERFEK